ncbi:hypothetical protein EZS27_038304, partial [termite gut metagenome]
MSSPNPLIFPVIDTYSVLSKGDVAAAESYLGQASGANYLNEALGNLYIASGQYERAVSS